MTNLSGRHLARLVLDHYETENAYINLALTRTLNEFEPADRREKAFCSELVYGVLRNLLKIDFILGRLLSRPLDSLKLPVKNSLRIAIYQLLELPEIPKHAVVNSAVMEIKNTKFSGLAGLVNGVLRNYLRSNNQIDLPDRQTDPVGYLTLEYSHPSWLVERWLERFGLETTESLLKINNEQPPLTGRINQHLVDCSNFKTELTEQGIPWRQGCLLEEAIKITNLDRSLEKLSIFQEGKIFIQDESSMLVAHLLDPHPDETIIDLCAAPGGKSTHLAELTKDQCRIISVDDHPHKIDLIKENASRLKLKSIEPILGDARDIFREEIPVFDGVLVDAPCSGTGVLRRRIDARYRRRPEDIKALAILQREILAHAARLVRPGGRLVYSTCTLEPEENQAQIQWFIEQYPDFSIESYREYLPSSLEACLWEPKNRQWAMLLPVSDGGDGFFMCRLKRINP
ncbi:MAG: 16S rRNA (cytosine(967)-C(5))-methyltransferase RsmB [Firmicutes bacterium]|nr:16S rRNA (cytosine(967)-C(5))-methyltransferase RsmB [Bacillota bacterium]